MGFKLLATTVAFALVSGCLGAILKDSDSLKDSDKNYDFVIVGGQLMSH